MAHRLPNRVLEVTTVAGVADVPLGGALPGYFPFATGMAVNDTVHYQIVAVDVVGRPTGQWEIGKGTLTAAAVLRRDSVVWNSSNTVAKLAFAAGIKQVSATILSPTLLDSSEVVQMDWQSALGLDLAGAVMHFGAPTAPVGWLKCNGAAISRTTYARLFARIGGYFGSGDGTNTFNVPDLRGEFIRGFDDGRTVDNGRGFASYQGSQNLSHAHGVYDPGHAHGVADPGHAHSAWTDAQGQHAHNYMRASFTGSGTGSLGFVGNITAGENNAGTDGAGNHAHNVGIGGAGTGIGIYAAGTGIGIYADGGAEARPRNIAMLACIKY